MDPKAEASSQELTSAGLLNLLHRRLAALGGDAAGRALVERLLAAAAGPYFDILGRWLAEGVLDDPYSEFMVKVGGGAGQRCVQRQRAASAVSLQPRARRRSWVELCLLWITRHMGRDPWVLQECALFDGALWLWWMAPHPQFPSHLLWRRRRTPAWGATRWRTTSS